MKMLAITAHTFITAQPTVRETTFRCPKKIVQPNLIRGRECDGEQGERSAGEGQSERNELILQIRTIFRESPDAIEGNFQRQENTGRADEQHDDGDGLNAVMARHVAQVLDDEILAGRQIISQKVQDDVEHGFRMEEAPDQREQQHHERKERQTALHATENPKVCTSVRVRYFSVGQACSRSSRPIS